MLPIRVEEDGECYRVSMMPQVMEKVVAGGGRAVEGTMAG